jgi:transposase
MKKHNQRKRQSKSRKKRSKKVNLDSLPFVNINAAGIDIGSEEHWVAVPEDRDEEPVRPFGCFTSDLHAMAEWLKQCGIETVAMESTGVYWISLFQILETQGFDVKLVNARHVKNVPGRKTDVQDCQWLQQLHTYGLLSGSFRPEDSICVLRSYWRHRDNLIRYAAAHIQHMQKALTEMNLQLHKVISDITGVTGMRIIQAILDGERDPVKLAQMRDPRIKSSEEKIAKALEGDYRQEHLFALKQSLELYSHYHQQVQACDQQIETYLSDLDSKFDTDCEPKPKKGRSKNDPSFDLATHLYRLTGVDFTEIDGLNVLTVHTVLSEVGLNPEAFGTEKRFASWLGLCPENRITGGQLKGSKTRKVVNRASKAFRLAANSLKNSPSALGGYYRRMRARLGPAKAITATAHKLARIFFHLWKNGGSYQDLGAEYYEKKYKERILKNMKRRAKRLGFELTLKPLTETGVS